MCTFLPIAWAFYKNADRKLSPDNIYAGAFYKNAKDELSPDDYKVKEKRIS